MFEPIRYANLNGRQKENFNFFKLASRLAEYGYYSHRLSDDWNGADLLAIRIGGEPILRIQLKTRLVFKQSYMGQSLLIAFPQKDDWYVFPHDETSAAIHKINRFMNSNSWIQHGAYSWNIVPQQVLAALKPFRLGRT